MINIYVVWALSSTYYERVDGISALTKDDIKFLTEIVNQCYEVDLM